MGALVFSHVSVMPQEVLNYWVTSPDGVYVDNTAGGGGHSRLLLESHPKARLVAIDQDPVALAEVRQDLEEYEDRVTLISGNFRNLRSLLDERGIGPVDGVLFDLGVSSPQLDVAERGFSYQVDAPLDMRMDPDNPVTAFRLINVRPVEEIAHVIKEWGEERWASRIAEFIVEARKREPIRTTGQLVELIKAAIPASARRTGGHPARRTFQALRIWVNDELGALRDGLVAAFGVLRSQGNIVVISFHSLEDRIVKVQFREWQTDNVGRVLTRRPVVPQDDEVQANARARSAKLRVFQKG